MIRLLKERDKVEMLAPEFADDKKGTAIFIAGDYIEVKLKKSGKQVRQHRHDIRRLKSYNPFKFVFAYLSRLFVY